MLVGAAGVIFDWIRYGSLLFLTSAGLSVPTGLMNFIHLAHRVFGAGGRGLRALRTRVGARGGDSVANALGWARVGINVPRVFSVTFGVGSGLAGCGAGLGIDVLGLDPAFPFRYLVYFLLVLAV